MYLVDSRGGGVNTVGLCYLLLPLINTIVCLLLIQLTDVLILVFLLSSAVSNETRTPDTLHLQTPETSYLTEMKRKHHSSHTWVVGGVMGLTGREGKINR